MPFLFFFFGIGDFILDMIGLVAAGFLTKQEKYMEWAAIAMVYLLVKVGIVIVCMILTIKKEFPELFKKILILFSYGMMIGMLPLSILICIGLCVSLNKEYEAGEVMDFKDSVMAIITLVLWCFFQYVFGALFFLYFKWIISSKNVSISHIDARNFQDIATASAPNKT